MLVRRQMLPMSHRTLVRWQALVQCFSIRQAIRPIFLESRPSVQAGFHQPEWEEECNLRMRILCIILRVLALVCDLH